MTVLDIDLDFFVSPRATNVSLSAVERLSEDRYTTEPESSAIDFLHEHCRIPSSGLPGQVFEHHDEVFEFGKTWEEPVDLIHIDAHSDLGGGFTTCWTYVCGEYLDGSIAQRMNPRRGLRGLNCGNFVVFLAACGLLKSVTFVSPECWANDYHHYYMKDFGSGGYDLELKRFSEEGFRAVDSMGLPAKGEYRVDTEVPFTRVPRGQFTVNGEPDQLLLTRSPGYTPKSADRLFDQIAALIRAR